MRQLIQGTEHYQGTLFPEPWANYVAEDNPVRVIEVLSGSSIL